MKLKNINISLLILSGLLLLSFAFFVTAQEKNSGATSSIFLDSDQDDLTDSEEKLYGTDPHNPDTDGDGYKDGTEVKAGYNPLKPAPGDKLPNSKDRKQPEAKVQGIETSITEENLTQTIAQKISAITSETDPENQEVTMDEIQEIINSSLLGQSVEDEMPEISEDDIKIKKQNYGKLSSAKAQEKKKEDFTDYLSAVLYILASNSPKPLTSANNIPTVINQITQQIVTAISLRKAENVEDLKKSGEKIAEQLKEVEVPEDLIETHIKILQYTQHMTSLQDLMKTDSEDPLASLVNYSKIQAFVGSLFDFYESLQSKLEEYDIKYEDIQDNIKKYGIELPESDEASLDSDNEED